MYQKLRDISDITAGFPFRTAIVPDKSGDTLVLQAKNISNFGHFSNIKELIPVSVQISGNPYLQFGDILIVSRGMKAGAFRASVFKCTEKNVVASSSVHIIRIKDKLVLPEYLSIYLNSTDGQNSIADLISGSYIGSLPRSALADMKVPIPPMKTQQSIIDLHKNIQNQDKILERKKQLKQNIINSTFKNLIKK